MRGVASEEQRRRADNLPNSFGEQRRRHRYRFHKRAAGVIKELNKKVLTPAFESNEKKTGGTSRRSEVGGDSLEAGHSDDPRMCSERDPTRRRQPNPDSGETAGPDGHPDKI